MTSPRPAPVHANASSVLGGLLVLPFQLGIGGPGGWWIAHEPELSLGVDPDYDPVIPDLVGWRLEILPALPTTAQYHVVPDWVCEVVSPSTQRHDRVRKLPFYARAGVGHAWLLDPLAQTLEIYELDGGGWRVVGSHGGDEAVRAMPFTEIELDLSRMWPPASETD